MSDKKRFPAAAALAVASELIAQLQPHCHRIQVAGSLRRGVRLVGDIELLLIPKMARGGVPGDMFAQQDVDLADQRIDGLLREAVLSKRLNKKGSSTWGSQNKLAVDIKSGIPVDFFSTTEKNFWVSLVIRTGPKEFNIRLIQEAGKRSVKLHAYGVFEDINGGEIVPGSEEEVLAIAGLNWISPENRVDWINANKAQSMCVE